MSNQRPGSISEFFHTKDRKNAKYLKIDKQDGVCDAVNKMKLKIKLIGKKERKKLIKLLAKHRKKMESTIV